MRLAVCFECSTPEGLRVALKHQPGAQHSAGTSQSSVGLPPAIPGGGPARVGL